MLPGRSALLHRPALQAGRVASFSAIRCALECLAFFPEFNDQLFCVAVSRVQVGKILNFLIKFGCQVFSTFRRGFVRLGGTLKFITQLFGSFYDRQISGGITRIKIGRHIGTVDALREGLQTFWSVRLGKESEQ